MKKKKLRVGFVDDHKDIRKFISLQIQEHPDFELVGTCDDGSEIIEFLRINEVDVLVTDIRMKKVNGDQAIQNALKEFPDLKALAFTSAPTKTIVSSLERIGFKGVVSKEKSLQELFNAIIEAAVTDKYIVNVKQ